MGQQTQSIQTAWTAEAMIHSGILGVCVWALDALGVGTGVILAGLVVYIAAASVQHLFGTN
jgi:hypothetical protein